MKAIASTLIGLSQFSVLCFGNTSHSAEKGAMESFVLAVNHYKKNVADEEIVSWDQVAKVSPNLGGLNSYFKDSDISEVYSFIPSEERDKFPDGELILARYQPLQWPYAEPHQTNSSKPDHQPIRYLIYRDKDNVLKSRYWKEDDFQKMLEETGLSIPKPKKFTNYVNVIGKYDSRQNYANPKSPNFQKEFPTETPEPKEATISIDASESIQIPTSTAAQAEIEEPEPEKQPMWPWAVAGLALLAGIGWILSSRKNRDR